MSNFMPVTLRPEQWNLVIGLLEEQHGRLSMTAKSLPKVATTATRKSINDIEEILMDIADQHAPSDEEE